MAHQKREGLFEEVYKIIKRIPQGKVATYGQIAKIMNNESRIMNKGGGLNITPRIVGFALHANTDKVTPCHRVVNKDGRLAPNYTFGGWKEQHRRLKAEGVEFKDETHVDIARHLWRSKSQARNSKF